MAYSSLEAAVTVALSAPATLGCEWKLLAKDGVYVDNAPRTLNVVHLAPGNRAGVVVKCTWPGTFTFTATSEAAGGPGGGGRDAGPAPAGSGGGGGGPGGRKLLQTAETLLTFTVSASTKAAVGALGVFTAKKPTYLADVYNTDAVKALGVTVETHSFNFASAQGGCAAVFDTKSGQFDGSTSGSMTAGTVQVWTLSANDKHPFHIHINSFQLGSDASDPDGYYQVGDWHGGAVQVEFG
jgi:FtsP/CotA-like multicopper oxidase with cupredoxin domain